MAHGHDVHFLERLERLSTPETELALPLYQDPLLIRALLEQIRLPEGAARVALSLGDGPRGPFVVIARDGHFVTCLAEGMSPGAATSECRIIPVFMESGRADRQTWRLVTTGRRRSPADPGRQPVARRFEVCLPWYGSTSAA